jgi:hypothetical protein
MAAVLARADQTGVTLVQEGGVTQANGKQKATPSQSQSHIVHTHTPNGSLLSGDVADEPKPKYRGSLEECKAYCKSIDLPETDGEWFYDKCQGNGWKNGGEPIKDWKATIRAWKTAGYMASQKKPIHGTRIPTGKPSPDRNAGTANANVNHADYGKAVL